MKKVYLPDGLDLQLIIEQLPPSEIVDFNIDKLKYFLSLIISIPSNRKDATTDTGFTCLSSRRLKTKSADYRDYYRYAERVGIIECDHHFVEDEKCLGYRFTYVYRIKQELLPDIITKSKFQTCLRKERNRKKRSVQQLHHITDFLDHRLTLDYDLAKYYMRQIRDFKLANKSRWDINHAKSRKVGYTVYKDPFEQYQQALFAIEKIRDGEWLPHRDPSVMRVHSTLTNMPGVLRNMLTFEGRSLVACDLRNSQPYLMLRLLQPDFYFDWVIPGRKTPLCKAFGRPNWVVTDQHLRKILENPGYLLDRFEKSGQFLFFEPFSLKKENKRVKIHNLKNKTNTQYNHNQHTVTKWQYVMNGLDNQEVDLFMELVSGGKFYEGMIQHLGLDASTPKLKKLAREKAKIMMFMVLFSDNRFIGLKEAEPKRLFKKHFPTIYELIKFWKPSKNSELLATTLQSMESYLFIDVIARRFTKEHPGVPIFTIHDCLVTTEGHEYFLKRILEEELTYHIGVAPSIKLERWNESAVFEKYPFLTWPVEANQEAFS